VAGLLLSLVAGPARGHPGHAPPTVSIAVYEYKPSTIHAIAGDVVQWNWDGPDVNHSVTSDKGSSEVFDSGVANQEGASFTYFFATPGTFEYHCTEHDSMHGTVVVRAGAAVDRVAPRLTHVRARVRGRFAKLRFRISEKAGVTARARSSRARHRSFKFVTKGRARTRVKLGGHGSYRVSLSAEDATGNTSKTFKVTLHR
jgi:plastocyanin